MRAFKEVMEILAITLLILIYFIVETIYLDYFKYKKENQQTINKIEDFLELRKNDIQVLSEQLIKNYKCRLCHAEKMDTNVISFSGKEYSHISRKRPHKFLKATCMGCGSTQFFNMNLIWGPDGLDPLPIDQPIYHRFIAMTHPFPCAYCKEASAVAKIITVRKKGVRHMLSPEPSELVTLCCKICGWSKFFDVQAIKKLEKIHART